MLIRFSCKCEPRKGKMAPVSSSAPHGRAVLPFILSVRANCSRLSFAFSDVANGAFLATGATFIAFLLAFSQNLVFTLIASIVSLVAATITLIAFAIDIALFAYVKNKMEDLNEIAYKTSPGPGVFYLYLGCWPSRG